MSILYDLALFPVKSVINSLQILERTTMEKGQKTEPVSHGSNEKVINSNKVRIRRLELYRYTLIKRILRFLTKY